MEHDQFAVEDQVHADASGSLELGKVLGEVSPRAGLKVQTAAAEEGDDPVSVELLLPEHASRRARRRKRGPCLGAHRRDRRFQHVPMLP
nr:hypothetical protein [Streptomyces albidoflavus]